MSITEWIKYFLGFFKKKKDISLKKIVNSLGFSVNDIYKEWTLNISPKKFLSLLRLIVAFELLSQSHRKIRDIAEELKFCDHIYFCRWFKKWTGIPPKRFQLKYSKYFKQGKLEKIRLGSIDPNLIYWFLKILENDEKIDSLVLDFCSLGSRNSENKNKIQHILAQKGG